MIKWKKHFENPVSPNQVEIAASTSTTSDMFHVSAVSRRVFSHTSSALICCVAGENFNKENDAASKAFNKLNNDLIFLPKRQQH